MALTPMMQQYFKIKEEYPDCIIFFRLGDFYEMFFEDAEVASKELELVLTGRDCGLEERAPMCGIPYHASKNYIGRLVEKGFKVAIVEQLEDPALAKGIVKRDVIRIITPGTLNDETFLNEERNNYLMAILNSEEKNPMISLAIADITTGEFYTTTFKSDKEALKGEIAKFTPREFLLLKEDDLKDFLSSEYTQLITYNTDYLVDDESLILNHHFSVIDGEIPLNGKRVVMGLLKYLEETQKASLSNMSHLSAYNISDTMALDINSKRNLELTENIVDKSKKGSLLWILDDTMTAMGARNLRRWIEKPLINQKEITKRLESVDVLVNDLALLENLRSGLKNVYDIERITGKISQKSINAKELITLKNSLNKVPGIKELLSGINFGELGKIGEKIDPLDDIRELLESSINDNPSMSLKDGDIIKEGYNREIDELRDIKANGKVWIANLESKEREFTGINSLKIGYNKVFGYYIEITKSNYSKIPEGRYVRKQTLANAERFITEELKEMEDKILGAEDKLSTLEYRLFTEIRDRVEEETERLKGTAALLSDLDCYQSFAKVALDRNYVRPVFNQEGVIKIEEGRHPVVEAMIPRGEFVSNDTLLDFKRNNFLVITGPNMAGKSTYMRQVALIVLMAQLGSFVPAKSANISITDRIFTRIGASDDLSGGKSTFMVEMTEVSNILRNATRYSLILLDEVGRGTSTYDGLSIAWAVTEHLMEDDGIKARTLFATHYHELTELEKNIPGIRNYSVAVKEYGNSIIFLRKIVEGGADESYGVEVARLAGLPDEVIKRSRSILKQLEDSGKKKKIKEKAQNIYQMNFMDFEQISENKTEKDVLEELRSLDVNKLSPLDALNLLDGLKNKLGREN